ncbi:MAG: hypothetical protein J6Z02_10390 [Lachnospiraceae bacterium]|nr:hypothetical protein [Lachnospiraceae bacterium]
MKKRLTSFVLILAMVLSMLPGFKAKAATVAYLYNSKKPNTILNDTKNSYIYVGGAKLNLDYNIGGLKSGVTGKWSSNHPERITVNKNGVCKAVGNGAAYITFKYTDPLTKKSAKLRVRLKALTRASGITLVPAEGTNVNAGELKMKPGEVASFGTKLTTNPKALAVNPQVTTTYGTYFELFQDAACTLPAGSNVVSIVGSGIVNAVAPGVVYLRAVGKNSKNATTYNVYSSVVKITVAEEISVVQTDGSKLKVTSPSSDILSITLKNDKGVVVTQLGGSPVLALDKRSAIVTIGGTLSGDYSVVITTVAETVTRTVKCEASRLEKIELTSTKAGITGEVKNGYSIATINFKLLDQFGNNVTNDARFPIAQFMALWTPANGDGTEKAVITGPGTVELQLKSSTILSKGKLLIIQTYGQATKIEADISIGLPAAIDSVEVMGIYKCGIGTTSMVNYTKVLDESTCSIFAGTVVADSKKLNNMPGAYYLLLRVKDTDGNPVNSKGVTNQRIIVSMNGTAGLELDGNESIDGITIDGETFLTYPVKAIASVRSGSFGLSALAVGGKVAYKTITKQIPGSLTVQKFGITGGKVCYAGQAEYLDYELIDSTGSRITDFEAVVKLTIQRDAANEVYISIPNTVISSTVVQNGVGTSTNSFFFWEKDMETGKAKLKYFPVAIGTDTIVTLPSNATATTTTTNVIVMVAQ